MSSQTCPTSRKRTYRALSSRPSAIVNRYSSASSGTTRSHSIRGSSRWKIAKTANAETFTRNVIPMATEADSGIRIGSKARRRRVMPPATIDGSMMVTESMKNRNRRIPIRSQSVKSSVWFAVRRRCANTSQSTPKYASGFTTDQT